MKKNLIIGLIALLIVIAVAVTVVLVIPKNGGNEQSSSADSSDVEEKQDYDMSDVCWTYSEKFVYDGEAKKIELKGLPDGVTVKSYTDNEKTDAGRYTAKAILSYDDKNYNEPTVPDCDWEIGKAYITGIEFASKTFEYDEQTHYLEAVGNIPADSDVVIRYDGEEIDGVTEVGEYEVTLEIKNKNYFDYTDSAKLTIRSTEKMLYSIVSSDGVYFQNALDDDKMYLYSGGSLVKINNDLPKYLCADGDKIYYQSSSLFSGAIKQYDKTNKSSVLISVAGEWLTVDGEYLYYAVNNVLINKELNGIYRVKTDGTGEAVRLVKTRAEYLTLCGGQIYYSNTDDYGRLYSVSADSVETETGKKISDEKCSYIITDGTNLYFNSAKMKAGVPVAAAIRKYVPSTGTNIKLTTDSGKYLTKYQNFLYYVNDDLLTGSLFGDGIYRVSVLSTADTNTSGTKILSAEDNGYSSLEQDGASLYYYKLNDKHFYSYDLDSGNEKDLMKDFVVQEEKVAPSGYSFVTDYNGEIYYTDPLDGNCLYKYNAKSRKKFKVLADNVSNAYFYNGYMYYSTYVVTNYALWRMNLKTNETQKIATCRCDNLIFDGDTIYCIKVGSAYNNKIVKMGLDGSNFTEIYNDKNLWVKSLELQGDYLYFTINPAFGKKYAYRYNLKSGVSENLNLRSDQLVVGGNKIYYYDIDDNEIKSSDLDGKDIKTIVKNVKINDMKIADGKLYYSSSAKTIGFYSLILGNGTPVKISDKAAHGICVTQKGVYFLQSAVGYSNDYPVQTSGYDGKLYAFDGKTVKAL
ncbi:MAG: DUF5050 domain-containing protein [Candidatus Borkfalkiaceae bacterium]|nr:DUF5050 domain-containing protein [Christensenellaceae bacterium]